MYMKRFFVFIFLCVLLANVKAVKIESGSLRELAKAGIANFEVDYSNAVIHGMSEEEFAEYELDWDKDLPQILALFRGNLAERAGDYLALVTKKKASLTLRWVVLFINTKGDTKSELHVLDADGTILAKIVELNGEGGTFGSKLNLIKDGAKSSGKKAGSFLKRELKKALKE
mgnify:CR=1 FL=1